MGKHGSVGKRRTRKQKQKAKHQFNLKKEYVAGAKSFGKKVKSTISVKGQFGEKSKSHRLKLGGEKVAKDKAKVDNPASTKHEIVKVLIQASIILGLELMLYLYLKFKLP